MNAAAMSAQSALTAEMMNQHQKMSSTSTGSSAESLDKLLSDYFNDLMSKGILGEQSIMDVMNAFVTSNLDDAKSVLDNFGNLCGLKIEGGSQLFNQITTGFNLKNKESFLDARITAPINISGGQGH